ncbi:MAG: hypothetical protein QOG46_203, partial [Pseudonocardiales bacterium]|nr:hypothetical protein [Pseudonocardiales bacterium]
MRSWTPVARVVRQTKADAGLHSCVVTAIGEFAYRLAGISGLGVTAVGYGRWPPCRIGFRDGSVIGNRLDEANDESPGDTS